MWILFCCLKRYFCQVFVLILLWIVNHLTAAKSVNGQKCGPKCHKWKGNNYSSPRKQWGHIENIKLQDGLLKSWVSPKEGHQGWTHKEPCKWDFHSKWKEKVTLVGKQTLTGPVHHIWQSIDIKRNWRCIYIH